MQAVPVGRLDVNRLRADAEVITLPPFAAGLPTPGSLLLRACVVLQRINGGGTFYLTYEDAARLLKCSKPAAQKYFRHLVGEVYLERVGEPGNNQFRGMAQQPAGGRETIALTAPPPVPSAAPGRRDTAPTSAAGPTPSRPAAAAAPATGRPACAGASAPPPVPRPVTFPAPRRDFPN